MQIPSGNDNKKRKSNGPGGLNRSLSDGPFPGKLQKTALRRNGGGNLYSVRSRVFAALLSISSALAQAPSSLAGVRGDIAVGAQYDSSHVYVEPAEVEPFVTSFLGTFGGTSTKPALVTVTPTPSKTNSQLLQTPVGIVSLFAYTTPIPAPFGAERTGYLVKDLDEALRAVQAAGGEVVVPAFADPIGRDAIVRFPGGVMMQLYWHTTPPHYPAFVHVPENRVYLSSKAANKFIRSFRMFADARIVSDEPQADGVAIGRPGHTYRRVGLGSLFGRMTLMVTDLQTGYPYGRETTGYEVDDLASTLTKAKGVGVKVLTEPVRVDGRTAVMVEFPGGYFAEIHSVLAAGAK
jgi:predicted enzyme related to lactoylglutathione lyase